MALTKIDVLHDPCEQVVEFIRHDLGAYMCLLMARTVFFLPSILFVPIGIDQ